MRSWNLQIFFLSFRIQIVLPSKSIRNEKILETLMVQANSGMYRVQDSYLEACQNVQKQASEHNLGIKLVEPCIFTVNLLSYTYFSFHMINFEEIIYHYPGTKL